MLAGLELAVHARNLSRWVEDHPRRVEATAAIRFAALGMLLATLDSSACFGIQTRAIGQQALRYQTGPVASSLPGIRGHASF